ncbi:helix-turn-helix domain-containing protein [Calidifontibacillus oryziterrae]|uniref:6-phosphofructo-2-kinase domain-containing protein n=1 Tax=Calidifontibacillus oryziterrae TaxID=1191699 RepID=UPI000308B951|nr:6-phosphofructo-2-kinase domain-containing protein [Calidifontibacillus oryziterrae]
MANKILKHDEALKLVYSLIASLRDGGKEKITITEVAEISEVSRATIYSKHPDWVEVRDVIKNNKPSKQLKLALAKNYEQTKWQIEAQRLENELRTCQEKLDFISEQADNVFKKLLDELHKYMYLAKKTPEQIERETNTLFEIKELKDRCEFYETEIKRLKIDSGRNTKMVPFVKKEIIDVYTETQRGNISNLDLLELTYEALLNFNRLFSKSYPPTIVYVLCGNFASGKSSWIADHKPQNVGSVVYFDGTNHTQSIRRIILRYIRNLNSDCKIVCVRILCDTRECLERNINESRIRLNTTIPKELIIKFAEIFEEVTVKEGFDEIIIGGSRNV